MVNTIPTVVTTLEIGRNEMERTVKTVISAFTVRDLIVPFLDQLGLIHENEEVLDFDISPLDCNNSHTITVELKKNAT
jgi:hypothetical protein